MKSNDKSLFIVSVMIFLFFLTALYPTMAMAVNARFEVNKMGNMSDFDPSNPVIPTGDTIRIAVLGAFSGPAAGVGEGFFLNAQWVAHDYNKRGGIFVDGKKKLVQILKADDGGNPAKARQVCEKMAIQEKVHAIIGANGSHIAKVMNLAANKYKFIALNNVSLSDDLQDATNFSRYAFQSWWQTSQVGRAFAYYYGQIRKKEKKFYIICQDYLFGHDLAESFKKGLKEFYPEAQIVGEDYHRLFMTDFAPYLTKIKAAGAEVVFTGDWDPDAGNLLKQARQMGIKLPFAHIFMVGPTMLSQVGVEGTKGLMLASCYSNGNPEFGAPEMAKFHKMMMDQYKKFKTPYNGKNYEQGWAPLTMHVYWLLSVIERAQSTDPEKIIKVWEGDTYQFVNGHQVKMRACDHNTIQDIHIIEYAAPDQQKVAFNIPPYYWTKEYSYYGPAFRIPAEKILPWMDPKLERCQGKDPSGH